MDAVRLSVDRFCLLAGVEALAEMMEEDATTAGPDIVAMGTVGVIAGAIHRARSAIEVNQAGKEVGLESWQGNLCSSGRST